MVNADRDIERLIEADIAPLLECLEHEDEDVKAAALAALVRLPLALEAWAEVALRAMAILRGGWPDPALVGPLARVPERTVRSELHELVACAPPPVRSATAHALAVVGDPAGAASLLEELGDESEGVRRAAAESVACCGFGDKAAARQAWKTARHDSVGDVRLLVSIGVARSGSLRPLRRTMKELRTGALVSDYAFGDTMHTPLTSLPPLPAPALEVIERAAERTGMSLLTDMLDTQRAAVAPARSAGGAAEEVAAGEAVAPERRAQVRQVVAELLESPDLSAPEPSDYERWERLVGALHEGLPCLPREEVSAFVSRVFSAVDPQRWDIGNTIVSLLGPARGLCPDVFTLFEAHERLGRGALGWQSAWVASRAPLGDVIGAVAEVLRGAASARRIAAARFIEDTARYASHEWGPQFGGGGAPGDVAPPEMMDLDITVAGPPRATAEGSARPAAAADEGTAMFDDAGAVEDLEAPDAAAPESRSGIFDAVEEVEPPARGGRFGLGGGRRRGVRKKTTRRSGGGRRAAPPEEPEAAPSDADEDEKVYARLDGPDSVVAGEEFELIVGIAPRPSAGVVGAPLEGLAGRRNYFLRVQVVADGFRLRRGESWCTTLAVTDDQRHPTCTLHLTAERPEGAFAARVVQATYSVQGQVAGAAARAITVLADEASRPAAPPPEAPRGRDFSIPTSAVPADLTVVLTRAVDPGTLRLTMVTPHESVDLPDEDLEVAIGDRPDAYAQQLIQAMNALEGRQGLYLTLRGRGRLLARMLPDEFWRALRQVDALVDGCPTVLLVSEDPFVPWELAEVDPPLDDTAAPLLAAQVVLGRWILHDVEQPPPHELLVTTMAAVAGEYDNPRWANLENALQERSDLVQQWGAEPVDAVFADVVAALRRAPGHSIIHIAMHGKYSPQGAVDGLALTDDEWISPDVVRGLALHDQPFVFLNACQVGSGAEVLGRYAGMASAFLQSGAAGVIAPLWSVKDDVARTIALAFYDATMRDGRSAGEAIRRERARFSDTGDAAEDGRSSTFVAYQFFGHPALRLVKGD